MGKVCFKEEREEQAACWEIWSYAKEETQRCLLAWGRRQGRQMSWGWRTGDTLQAIPGTSLGQMGNTLTSNFELPRQRQILLPG